MNECLITRLKGSVNDDSLPLLGTFVFLVKSTDSFFSFGGTGCTIKIFNANGELVETAQDYIYKNSLGYNARVVVDNKYNLKTISALNLSGSKLNTEDCVYCNELTTLNCIMTGNINDLSGLTKLVNMQLAEARGEGDLKGDISFISNFETTFKNIYINTKNNLVTGDVSVFANRDMSSITLFSTGIYGDVASFGKSVSANDLWIDKSGVSGAIEDLADAQLTNGRSSGSLIVHGNGIMTYNNVAFRSNKTITFSSGSYVIS